MNIRATEKYITPYETSCKGLPSGKILKMTETIIIKHPKTVKINEKQ